MIETDEAARLVYNIYAAGFAMFVALVVALLAMATAGF